VIDFYNDFFIKMRTLILLFALATGIFLSGCDAINPHEQVPTYVHIDSFSFQHAGSDSFGTTSHKITNIWVYVDNNEIGTYTMPCTFPVIADKPFVLRVAPGIDFNGLSGLKGIYSFYTFDSTSITPQPGKVVQFTPKTRYTTTTRVLLNLNFDFGPPPFTKFSGNGDSLHKAPNASYIFEGAGAAYLYLDSNKKYSENISNSSFNAAVGQNVFLELNYRCSVPFTIGLFTTNSAGDPIQSYFTGLNVKDSWNKVYISLQDFINTYQGRPYFILIRAGTDYEEQNGYIAIDNLKVIAF
jgi:hypothetical protein